MTIHRECRDILRLPRHARLEAALEMFELHPRGRKTCFRLLGQVWGIVDNIFEYEYQLSEILSNATRAELDAAMEPEAFEIYRALPDVLTVYRGTYQYCAPGLAWSLDRSVAEGFPFLPGYCQDVADFGLPTLLIGTVRKDECFHRMTEDEIVSACVDVVSTEFLAAETRA